MFVYFLFIKHLGYFTPPPSPKTTTSAEASNKGDINNKGAYSAGANFSAHDSNG